MYAQPGNARTVSIPTRLQVTHRDKVVEERGNGDRVDGQKEEREQERERPQARDQPRAGVLGNCDDCSRYRPANGYRQQDALEEVLNKEAQRLLQRSGKAHTGPDAFLQKCTSHEGWSDRQHGMWSSLRFGTGSTGVFLDQGKQLLLRANEGQVPSTSLEAQEARLLADHDSFPLGIGLSLLYLVETVAFLNHKGGVQGEWHVQHLQGIRGCSDCNNVTCSSSNIRAFF